VEIDLPPVGAAADLPQALNAVMAAMAAGEITPDEASAIAAVIESRRKAIETRIWTGASRRSNPPQVKEGGDEQHQEPDRTFGGVR
jgi:hypothetical protein